MDRKVTGDEIDLELHEIYQALDEETNIYINEDGKRTIFLNGFEGGILLIIEQFVLAIEKSRKLAYAEKIDSAGKTNIVEQPLAKYFRQFNGFMAAWHEAYEFSERVKLFFETYRLFDFGEEDPRRFAWPSIVDGEQPLWKRCNQFIEHIRQACRSQRFRNFEKRRRERSRRQFESMVLLVQALRQRHSKLMVVRVDFGYRLGTDDVIPDRAHRDLARLLNNARGNKLFRHRVGYIWKLEFGEAKGYHFHCVFFFNGDRVQKDAYYAQQICEYWNAVITAGCGTSHNCNKEKSKYNRCGVGMLHRDNDEKHANFLEAVKYLAKKEQYLRVKLKKHPRTYGRSAIPKARGKVVEG